MAMAESAFAGMLGMEIELSHVPREGIERNDTLLFSESQSRFVITVHPEHADGFERVMKGAPLGRIGIVKEGGEFIVRGLDGRTVIDSDVKGLKEAWKRTLDW